MSQTLFSKPTQSDFKNRQLKKRNDWWSPIWRGLAFDRTAKHRNAMGIALWLYIYFVIHADWTTGTMFRTVKRIATDMGISDKTIRRWLSTLRRHGYITTSQTGRAVKIQIQKWRSIKKSSQLRKSLNR